MEKIDFSPLKGQMNHMVIQIALIIVIPLVAGLIVKWILRKFKIPNGIANIISVLVLLVLFYRTFQIVVG
ncbi:hypothetical protein [Heyndrickxia oleronia]|uniref:hypothetical protein n=1 Tax=Heyndrickxia oleronia TaxID=38875 RepID=UPI003F851752